MTPLTETEIQWAKFLSKKGGKPMTMKNRMIRCVIKWIFKMFPYQAMDIMIPQDMHLHYNPGKKPQEAVYVR